MIGRVVHRGYIAPLSWYCCSSDALHPVVHENVKSSCLIVDIAKNDFAVGEEAHVTNLNVHFISD